MKKLIMWAVIGLISCLPTLAEAENPDGDIGKPIITLFISKGFGSGESELTWMGDTASQDLDYGDWGRYLKLEYPSSEKMTIFAVGEFNT